MLEKMNKFFLNNPPLFVLVKNFMGYENKDEVKTSERNKHKQSKILGLLNVDTSNLKVMDKKVRFI